MMEENPLQVELTSIIRDVQTSRRDDERALYMEALNDFLEKYSIEPDPGLIHTAKSYYERLLSSSKSPNPYERIIGLKLVKWVLQVSSLIVGTDASGANSIDAKMDSKSASQSTNNVSNNGNFAGFNSSTALQTLVIADDNSSALKLASLCKMVEPTFKEFPRSQRVLILAADTLEDILTRINGSANAAAAMDIVESLLRRGLEMLAGVPLSALFPGLKSPVTTTAIAATANLTSLNMAGNGGAGMAAVQPEVRPRTASMGLVTPNTVRQRAASSGVAVINSGIGGIVTAASGTNAAAVSGGNAGNNGGNAGNVNAERRPSGVLIVRSVARTVPSVFNQYLQRFIEIVKIALRDHSIAVKEQVHQTLCEVLLAYSARDVENGSIWFEELYSSAQNALMQPNSANSNLAGNSTSVTKDSSSSSNSGSNNGNIMSNGENAHSALLLYDAIIRCLPHLLTERHCAAIVSSLLALRGHKDSAVRAAVLGLLPEVANVNPDYFMREAAGPALAHILGAITKGSSSAAAAADRAEAFAALGRLTLVLGCERLDARATADISDALVNVLLSPKMPAYVDEALACVAQVTQVLRAPKLAKTIPHVLPQLMALGLSRSLIRSLDALCKTFPTLRADLQERIFMLLTHTFKRQLRLLKLQSQAYVAQFRQQSMSFIAPIPASPRQESGLASPVPGTSANGNGSTSPSGSRAQSPLLFHHNYRLMERAGGPAASSMGPSSYDISAPPTSPVAMAASIANLADVPAGMGGGGVVVGMTGGAIGATGSVVGAAGIGMAGAGAAGVGGSGGSDGDGPRRRYPLLVVNNSESGEFEPEVVILALKTLRIFDVNDYDVLKLANDAVPLLMSGDYIYIQREAALSCMALMFKTCSNPSISPAGYASKLVDQILLRMLDAAVSSPDLTTRLTVIENLTAEFDSHLARDSIIDSLFLLLSDDVFDVRYSVLLILGRLLLRSCPNASATSTSSSGGGGGGNSSLNGGAGAPFFPRLRTFLEQLLTNFSCSLDVRTKQQSAMLLELLIRIVPQLGCAYADAILNAIIPQLTFMNVKLNTAAIRVVGELSVAAPPGLAGYLDRLVPPIYAILRDKTTMPEHVARRETTLWALGELLQATGGAVRTLRKYPDILKTLMLGISTERDPRLRMELVKLVGIFGAVDPYSYRDVILRERRKIARNQTQKPSDFRLPYIPYEKPEYNTLTYHMSAIKCLEIVLKTLDKDTVQAYKRQLVEPLLVYIHKCRAELRAEVMNCLAIIAGVFKHHITIFASPIVDVMSQYWDERTLNASLALLEYFGVYMNDGCRDLLTRVIRPFVGSLSVEVRRRPKSIVNIERFIECIEILGPHLGRYYHMIFPTLNYLLQDSGTTLDIGCRYITMAGRMAKHTDATGYVSSVTVAVLNLVSRFNKAPPQKLLVAVVEAFTMFARYAPRAYAPFVPPVARIFSKFGVQNRAYNDTAAALLKCHSLGTVPTTPITAPPQRQSYDDPDADEFVLNYDGTNDDGDGNGFDGGFGSGVDDEFASPRKAGKGRKKEEDEDSDIVYRVTPIKVTNIDGEPMEDVNDDTDGGDDGGGSNGGSSSGGDDDYDGDGTDERGGSNNGGKNALKKGRFSSEILRDAWENTAQRFTKEDWVEWLRQYSLALLKDSPSPPLRACFALAQEYHPLVQDLFPAAFLSSWDKLKMAEKERLAALLDGVLANPAAPQEVVQALLGVLEFLEKLDRSFTAEAFFKLQQQQQQQQQQLQMQDSGVRRRSPSKRVPPSSQQLVMQQGLEGVPIDARPLSVSRLVSASVDCRAYAKALRLKENQYRGDQTNMDYVEDLISINNRLQLYDASKGVLAHTEKVCHIEMSASLLEKLCEWDRALEIHESVLRATPEDTNALLGSLRCLHAIGDYRRVANIAQFTWKRQEEDPRMLTPESRREAAEIAVQAALATESWDALSVYVEALPRDSVMHGVARAALLVHNREFDSARSCIMRARAALDTEVSALVSESYERAYPLIVRAQQLSELEQAIDYLEAPAGRSGEERREVIRTAFSDRLRRVVAYEIDAWQSILNVQGLAVDKHAYPDMWIKFASLCRKQNRPALAMQVLEDLARTTMRDLSRSLTRINPRISLAAAKVLWALNKTPVEYEKTIEFVSLLKDIVLSSTASSAPSSSSGSSGMMVQQQQQQQQMSSAQQFKDPRLVAKLHLLIGNWKYELGKMLGPDAARAAIPQATECFRAAIECQPHWLKGVSTWAHFNCDLVAMCEATCGNGSSGSNGNADIPDVDPYLTAALDSLVRAIQLAAAEREREKPVFQDMLRLVTLAFNHGHRECARPILDNAVRTLSPDLWIKVIPELISRIHVRSDGIRRFISAVVAVLCEHHPHAIVYPLLVAVKSRAPLAQTLFEQLKKSAPAVAAQAEVFTHELVRLSINWFEMWCVAINDASRICFDENNLFRMRKVLDPLFKLFARGSDIQIDRLFIQRIGPKIRDAHKALVDAFAEADAAVERRKKLRQKRRENPRGKSESGDGGSSKLKSLSSQKAMGAKSKKGGGSGSNKARRNGKIDMISISSSGSDSDSDSDSGYDSSSYSDSDSGSDSENDAEKINKDSIMVMWDYMYAIYNELERFNKGMRSANLRQCAPLLLQTDFSGLCIPGTYLPHESNISITAVAETAPIFTSKQRPRQVLLTGSNGVDYQFLLKAHEDLRQDERAMQFFELVNTLLSGDTATHKDHLNIVRYAVVPLSQNTGIIGWVLHSNTLHELIKEYRALKRTPFEIECKFQRDIVPQYDTLTALQKVEVLQYILGRTSGNDLKHIMWRRSANSEEWLQRRVHFARSTAVMSMVGHILGIGDRHPSNILVDKDTGDVIHIDFGDCFEVAMHRQAYPERIPFRLTRMFVNAMEVSGIEGTYRLTCEKVLRVLRDNRESLLTVLETFVYDPLLSWRTSVNNGAGNGENGGNGNGGGARDSDESMVQRHARLEASRLYREANSDSIPASLSIASWVSCSENEIALHLGNMEEGDFEAPAAEQDVRKNPRALSMMKRVNNKLNGMEIHGSSERMTVRDQVEYLIQKATDPENIAACFKGWCPFW